MNGLVLEGGGLRGMFTSGVLDAFDEAGLKFDGIIGVSAGALFGVNYKSRQRGRALRYNLAMRNEPRYMGWKCLLKTRNIVSPDFSYHILPFEIDIFDKETFDTNPTDFWMVCTDILTGQPVYHKMQEFSHHEMEWCRATASMPVVSTPVEIDGYTLLDGGMVDAIPLKKFQEMGYDRNIVVLTQPRDYFKKKMKITWLIKLLSKKYPMVGKIMEKRHLMYNEELEYIAQEEKKGNTLIIAPDQPLGIGRTELSEKKIKAVYQMGYEKGKSFLSDPRTKGIFERLEVRG